MDVPRDLEGALLDLGIMPTKTDDDEVWALCPDHLSNTGRQDSHASWSVNRVSGLVNCFSCSAQGTFLDLAMRRKFPHDIFAAVRWMREFGISTASAAELTGYNDNAAPEPVEVVPETRLATFEPNPPGWALDARKVSLEACLHYGIRWNTENDSWIIPIRNPDGSLAGWQEKWQHQRRFINWPKDMQKSQCLFGFDVFPVGDPAVLLESPMDVAVLHTAGFTGGLATYGAAWSKRQLSLIMAVTDELVCALDNDDSGREHAEILRNGKHRRGKRVEPGYASRIHLRFFNYGKTGNKDIGDMEHGDIRRGLYDSQHSILVDLANSEQRKELDVYRFTSSLPAARRQGNDRSRAVSADRRGRDGKVPDDHRRGRGAGRGVR